MKSRKETKTRERVLVSSQGARQHVTETTDVTFIMLASGAESRSNPHRTYHLSNGVEIKKQADGTFKIPGSDDVFTVEQ